MFLGCRVSAEAQTSAVSCTYSNTFLLTQGHFWPPADQFAFLLIFIAEQDLSYPIML